MTCFENNLCVSRDASTLSAGVLRLSQPFGGRKDHSHRSVGSLWAGIRGRLWSCLGENRRAWCVCQGEFPCHEVITSFPSTYPILHAALRRVCLTWMGGSASPGGVVCRLRIMLGRSGVKARVGLSHFLFHFTHYLSRDFAHALAHPQNSPRRGTDLALYSREVFPYMQGGARRKLLDCCLNRPILEQRRVSSSWFRSRTLPRGWLARTPPKSDENRAGNTKKTARDSTEEIQTAPWAQLDIHDNFQSSLTGRVEPV